MFNAENLRRGRGRPRKNPVDAPKKKGKICEYNIFVGKEASSGNYNHLPRNERFAAIAVAWHEFKLTKLQVPIADIIP
jgi:hypothetical protein